MTSHKRRAKEPLLPIRAPKQARTSGQTSPTQTEELRARWAELMKDDVLGVVKKTFWLCCETFTSMLTGYTLEDHKPDQPDEPSALPSPPPSPSSKSPGQGRSRLPSQAHPEADPPPPPRPSFPQEYPPPVHPNYRELPLTVVQSGIVSPPSSHATSSAAASSSSLSGWQSVGEAFQQKQKNVTGKRKAYISREHIHHKQHKAHVQESWRKHKGEMARELYAYKKNAGYKADYRTFLNWTKYHARLDSYQLDALSPSRSVTDLHSPPIQASENRRHSYDDDFLQRGFLERALEKAKKSLASPRPKTFTLRFDEIQKEIQAIHEEVHYRIHGKPIPSTLPPEDDQFVEDLLAQQGVVAKCGREQVTDRDLSRLRPHQWLNDEIINFYGQMILDRSECKENPGGSPNGWKKPLDIFYFSTFFWTKLKNDGYERGRLARWTKKVDIFSKNIILVPVNHHNAHWTAAAINFDKKRIESHDSMGMERKNVFLLLRKYLAAEYRNKKNKPFDFTEWTDYVNEDLPQQENGWDCGVFTCQFLESLSRGEEKFAFHQDHMPYLRRRMMWEIGKVKLRDGP